MPWAPLPPAPLEVWGGFKACGCLWEFQEEVPNAAEWRARGIVEIRKIGARELRQSPLCCPRCYAKPEPMGDEVKVPGRRPPDPAPEGLFRAVLVDNHDLGTVETKFGDKPKVLLVWEIEEKNPKNENKPYLVYARFTVSMDGKSNLSKLLETWRAKKFTPEERAEGFDLDKLIGYPCQLQVVHNHAEDGTIYANIGGIMPMARGQEKLKPSETYVRMKDRKDEEPQGSRAGDGGAGVGGEEEEEQFPF